MIIVSEPTPVSLTAPRMATAEHTAAASPYLHLFRRYLRQQGLPVTQQREVVADVVFGSADHLSVEEIEARLKQRGERIGKATIYRTMEILVRSGLVEELGHLMVDPHNQE